MQLAHLYISVQFLNMFGVYLIHILRKKSITNFSFEIIKQSATKSLRKQARIDSLSTLSSQTDTTS